MNYFLTSNRLVKLINLRAITLFLIIVQSCGIRFFPGQGSALAAVVLFFSIPGFKKLQHKDLLFLLFVGLVIVFSNLVNGTFLFSKVVFQFILIIEAYAFLLLYSNAATLLKELLLVLKGIFIHAVIGYLLYLLVPFLFQPVSFSDYEYKTFSYLFYIANSEGLPRNTGICWEPGLLQLMLNLFLFFSIRNKSSYLLLLFIILTILSTASSTGFILLGLQYVYFLFVHVKSKKKLLIAVFFTLLAFIPAAYIQHNLSNKFSGTNTSGLVRYRDFLIGYELIKEKPLLGHGNFSGEYLTSKPYVSNIEMNIFSEEYLSSSGELSGGYTNGLLGLLCLYGLPLGLGAYFMLYKNKIIGIGLNGRLLFFLILTLTFVSEPITYTAFFLLFPFSNFVYKKAAYQQASIVAA